MSDPRDLLDQPPKPAPTGPAEPPPTHEDAGAQALSEALRSSFSVVKILMFVLVAVFLGSGIFTVRQQERVVLLRFGKPVGQGEQALLGPGLHWAFPEPIDEKVRIPIGRVQSVSSSIGWYATTAAQSAARDEPPPEPSLNPARDGYLITGDRNIVHVRGVLRYRIKEPGLQYALNFVDGSNFVQNAFNNALLHAAARFTVDDILTQDIAGFREAIQARIEQVATDARLGITVDQVELQRPIPPRQLTTNFALVLQAEVRRSKALNDARSYANQTLSRAGAAAEARVNAGESDRAQLVQFVSAEATRFTELLPWYRSNPELFRRLHQTALLERVLTNSQDIVIPERGDGRSRELRIQIGREAQKSLTYELPKGEH